MRLEDLRQVFEKAGHSVSPRNDVDAAAVAWYFECSVGTLANWRSQRKGPPHASLPCGTRYPLIGLADYLESLVRK